MKRFPATEERSSGIRFIVGSVVIRWHGRVVVIDEGCDNYGKEVEKFYRGV